MAYDPVYAHEYYMAHRKLKGRKRSAKQDGPRKESMSGRNLTKEQRAELNEYWKGLKEDLSAEKENINDAKKGTIDKLNEQIAAKIDELKAFIELSPTKELKKKLREKIKELRKVKTDTRKEINEIAKNEYAAAKKKTYDAYNKRLNSMAK